MDIYDCSKTFRTDFIKQATCWIRENYYESQGGKVLLEAMYQDYRLRFCLPLQQEPKRRAEFGKIVRLAYPSIQKRRLGPAGQQVSYYVGLAKEDEEKAEAKKKMQRHNTHNTSLHNYGSLYKPYNNKGSPPTEWKIEKMQPVNFYRTFTATTTTTTPTTTHPLKKEKMEDSQTTLNPMSEDLFVLYEEEEDFITTYVTTTTTPTPTTCDTTFCYTDALPRDFFQSVQLPPSIFDKRFDFAPYAPPSCTTTTPATPPSQQLLQEDMFDNLLLNDAEMNWKDKSPTLGSFLPFLLFADADGVDVDTTEINPTTLSPTPDY